jgi:hypothetical protein
VFWGLSAAVKQFLGEDNPLNPAPAVRLSRPQGVWQLVAFVRVMRPGVSKQDSQGFPLARRTCRWWRKFRQLLRHFVLLCTLICLWPNNLEKNTNSSLIVVLNASDKRATKSCFDCLRPLRIVCGRSNKLRLPLNELICVNACRC